MFLEFNLIKLSLESSFHSFIHSHSQGYTLMPLMCCKNQCSHRCYSLTETSVSAGSLFLTGMTLHKKALKVTPQTKHFNHTSRAWEVAVKYSLYCIFMSCDQSVCILIRINSKTDSLSQQTRGEKSKHLHKLLYKKRNQNDHPQKFLYFFFTATFETYMSPYPPCVLYIWNNFAPEKKKKNLMI